MFIWNKQVNAARYIGINTISREKPQGLFIYSKFRIVPNVLIPSMGWHSLHFQLLGYIKFDISCGNRRSTVNNQYSNYRTIMKDVNNIIEILDGCLFVKSHISKDMNFQKIDKTKIGFMAWKLSETKRDRAIFVETDNPWKRQTTHNIIKKKSTLLRLRFVWLFVEIFWSCKGVSDTMFSRKAQKCNCDGKVDFEEI